MQIGNSAVASIPVLITGNCVFGLSSAAFTIGRGRLKQDPTPAKPLAYPLVYVIALREETDSSKVHTLL